LDCSVVLKPQLLLKHNVLYDKKYQQSTSENNYNHVVRDRLTVFTVWKENRTSNLDDLTSVTAVFVVELLVTDGWTNSSGSSANKLLLLDIVEGLTDAAFTLLVSGFASNVCCVSGGFAAGFYTETFTQTADYSLLTAN